VAVLLLPAQQDRQQGWIAANRLLTRRSIPVMKMSLHDWLLVKIASFANM
jgi:hypothetical protein